MAPHLGSIFIEANVMIDTGTCPRPQLCLCIMSHLVDEIDCGTGVVCHCSMLQLVNATVLIKLPPLVQYSLCRSVAHLRVWHRSVSCRSCV